MDNPVDVAFTTTGDRLLTATFLEHPQLGKRDALIHAVYGGVYGKPHGVIDGTRGPAICWDRSATSGRRRHRDSRATGTGFIQPGRETFYAALFNMQKVTRHDLVPNGSTFTSKDTDFLVADSLDFHPTDVIEDADGSLLVVDTGAWASCVVRRRSWRSRTCRERSTACGSAARQWWPTRADVVSTGRRRRRRR